MPNQAIAINPLPGNGHYRPDIDGLRALAILSVLFFHLGLTSFSGGYVGVDIFFVISGFLITSLIRREVRDTRTFNFTNFYVRRIRRLFPSLAFTLGATIVAAYIFLSDASYARFGASLASSLVSLSNFYFWLNTGYFAPNAELEPLLHSWSLSVEEQFYLFWPVMLLFLLKAPFRYAAALFLCIIFFASLVLNEFYINDSDLIFYLLPFRVFEFAIGASLVFINHYQPADKRWLEVAWLTGFLLVGYSIFNFTKLTPFPATNALLPCIGAGLIIYGGKARYSSRFLNNRAAVAIGLISYSIYLIHWPVLAFYKYYSGSEALTHMEQASLAILSIAIGALMYRYVEQPFRKSRHYDGSNKLFLIGCLTLFLVMMAVSLQVHYSEGKRWLSNSNIYQNAGYGGDGFEWIQKIGDKQAPTGLIIYGDSHSKQYLATFNDYGMAQGIGIEYLGHPACFSFPDVTNLYMGRVHQSCIDMWNRLLSATEGNHIPVLLAYRYTKEIVDWNGNSPVSYKEGQLYTTRFMEGLDKLVRRLGEDRPIIIVGNVPAAQLQRGYLDCISRPVTREVCHDKYPADQGEFFTFRKVLSDFAESRKNVMFIDPYQALCDQNDCYVVKDGKLFYSDHAHLSVEGANHVFQTYSAGINDFLSSRRIGLHE